MLPVLFQEFLERNLPVGIRVELPQGALEIQQVVLLPSEGFTFPFAREAVDASTETLDFIHVEEPRSVDIRDVEGVLDQPGPREGAVQIEGRAEFHEI